MSVRTVASPADGGPPLVHGFERGHTIGRYVVVGELGTGGMGVVYAAYDPELDRRVALKLLRPDIGATAGDEPRARLLREALALAKLSHPHVVRGRASAAAAGARCSTSCAAPAAGWRLRTRRGSCTATSSRTT
jgi:hypothetical protein